MRRPDRNARSRAAYAGVALRQDGGKVQAAVQHDRIGAGRQHRPADQRHGDHQGIERVMRQVRRELHRLRQIRRQRRRAVARRTAETDQREHEDGDAERLVRRNERKVFRHHGRHHADADEEHRQDAGGHQPVQQALQGGEALAALVMACHPLRFAIGIILGFRRAQVVRLRVGGGSRGRERIVRRP